MNQERSSLQGLKRFDFAKDGHHYSFYYDDVRILIDHLVDVADAGNCNIDLMDIFTLVRKLAGINKNPSHAG